MGQVEEGELSGHQVQAVGQVLSRVCVCSLANSQKDVSSRVPKTWGPKDACSPGRGPGSEGGLAMRGARGPPRDPGAVAWLEGGQTAGLGSQGASGLPWPPSPTPDAPGAATWPGGSGTTPGCRERVLQLRTGGEDNPLLPKPQRPTLNFSACCSTNRFCYFVSRLYLWSPSHRP